MFLRSHYVAVIIVFFINLVLGSGCTYKGPHQPLLGQNSGQGAKVTQGEGVGFDQVKPIFEKRCATCHPSKIAPDWSKYDKASPYIANGKLELRVVKKKDMPQAGSPEAAAMTQADRDLIAAWIATEKARSGGAAPSTPVVLSPEEQFKEMVASCTGCHGENGISTQNVVPNLAGQQAPYTVDQLKAFASNARTDKTLQTMNALAAGLKEEDMQKLAEHFGKMEMVQPNMQQTGAEPTTEEKALIEKGKALAASCVACHMADGYKAMEGVPHLAFQKAEYIVSQLKAFKSGERKTEAMGGAMAGFAATLSDEDMAALGAYFSRPQ